MKKLAQEISALECVRHMEGLCEDFNLNFEDKRLWRLIMQIPFEKIEGWFNHDLENKIKEIDKICK